MERKLHLFSTKMVLPGAMDEMCAGDRKSRGKKCVPFFSVSINIREASDTICFPSFLFLLSLLAFPHLIIQLPSEFKDFTPWTTEIALLITKKKWYFPQIRSQLGPRSRVQTWCFSPLPGCSLSITSQSIQYSIFKSSSLIHFSTAGPTVHLLLGILKVFLHLLEWRQRNTFGVCLWTSDESEHSTLSAKVI